MTEKKTAHPLTLGLALAAGLGLILMIIALASGSIQGESANTSAFNGLFAIGVAFLIAGIVGWVFVVQPYRRFDDINQPMDSGHHDTHAAPAGAAIVPAESHDVEQHAHS